MDFDPNAVGVYNLGVYVYSLKALCWPLLRSAWRPWTAATLLASTTTRARVHVLRQHQQPNSSPEEEFDWFGLSNDHMDVGVDACNNITASLGVLEPTWARVEPEQTTTNYQVNNGFADVPEGVEAGAAELLVGGIWAHTF